MLTALMFLIVLALIYVASTLTRLAKAAETATATWTRVADVAEWARMRAASPLDMDYLVFSRADVLGAQEWLAETDESIAVERRSITENRDPSKVPGSGEPPEDLINMLVTRSIARLRLSRMIDANIGVRTGRIPHGAARRLFDRLDENHPEYRDTLVERRRKAWKAVEGDDDDDGLAEMPEGAAEDIAAVEEAGRHEPSDDDDGDEWDVDDGN